MAYAFELDNAKISTKPSVIMSEIEQMGSIFEQIS